MTSLSQVARKIASIKDTVLGEAMSNKRFVAGLSMLIFIVLLGVVGSLFAPCPESAIIGLRCTDAQWLPPSPHHPLGTNQRGEDIFSWFTIGIRNSLWIALIAALIGTSIALVLGLAAGYIGGILDDLLNTLINFMMVIPTFILLLMLVVYIPPEVRTMHLVAVLIGILSWPGAARIVRSMAMQNKALDYVELAKLSNFSTIEILLKEILPNIGSYAFLIFVNLYSSAIFAEVGIGALGFAPLDAITLGRAFNDMLAGGAIFQGMWWWFVPLGLVVVMISFSLLSINLGLQAIFNPRLKLSPYAV
jgi:peptide/nickel transport system permease protein